MNVRGFNNTYINIEVHGARIKAVEKTKRHLEEGCRLEMIDGEALQLRINELATFS